MTAIISDPEAILKMINDLKDHARAGPPSYAPTVAPVYVQPNTGGESSSSAPSIADKRIFVALNTNLHRFELVRLVGSPSIEDVKREIAVKLNLIGTPKFRMELADVGVAVENVDDFQNNDKVIVTIIYT